MARPVSEKPGPGEESPEKPHRSREEIREAGQEVEADILRQAEEDLGVPVYQVPAKHEVGNLTGYLDETDTPETIKKRLELMWYIPDGCWRPIDLEEEDAEGYAAVLYLPKTRSILTIAMVLRKEKDRPPLVFLETYTTNPYDVASINPSEKGPYCQAPQTSKDFAETTRRQLQNAVKREALSKKEAQKRARAVTAAMRLTEKFEEVKKAALKNSKS